jgi:hypothetical protein
VHEQRIADEDIVADTIRDISRRVAVDVQHLHDRGTVLEALVICEEPIEVAALWL